MLLADRSFRRTVAGCNKNSSVVPGTLTRIALMDLSYITAVDTAGDTRVSIQKNFKWVGCHILFKSQNFYSRFGFISNKRRLFTLLAKLGTLLHHTNSDVWEDICNLALWVHNYFWITSISSCWELQIMSAKKKINNCFSPEWKSLCFKCHNVSTDCYQLNSKLLKHREV